MTKFKKLLAIVLSAMMLLTLLAVPSFGATTYTITINNNHAGHTYEAYQIFAGDLYDGVLSNIVWGAGVTEAGKTAMGDANNHAVAITSENVAAFAKSVSAYLASPSATSGTSYDEAAGTYTISGLEPGYYLVKDKDGSQTGAEEGRYTAYILEVVKNTTVSPKGAVPQVGKQTKDVNDSNASYDTGAWQDSADYDIGDDVPFLLTATMPDHIKTYYEKYKVVFHDTLSAGFDLPASASDFTVKVGDTTLTTSQFAYAAEGTHGFTITINDVIALGADAKTKVTVEYKAKLNDGAVVGAAGNPNTVYLEYSNNPNNSGDGTPGNPPETGVTPEDKVIIFTYEGLINKVDGNGDPLTGAEFTLEKKNNDGTWTAVTLTKNAAPVVVGDTTWAAGTRFTAKGLDDGTYRITETATPAGYNTIAPFEFEITATHEVNSPDPKLLSLSASDVTGITIAANATTGVVSTTVENKSGATLPSTGGMGTTLFYVFGGIMTIGAAVVLVTKKRMGEEQ